MISGCVNECVQQGRNGGRGPSGKIIATIKIQCDLKVTCMRYMHMSDRGAELFSRLTRAELFLLLFIYFCKNAGASDGEWVRSLIHLSGKHSFSLPPPIWPFLSSSAPAFFLSMCCTVPLFSAHIAHSQSYA